MLTTQLRLIQHAKRRWLIAPVLLIGAPICFVLWLLKIVLKSIRVLIQRTCTNRGVT